MSSFPDSILIGIVGGSAAGKTRFKNDLSAGLGNDLVCQVDQDNYYHPREKQIRDEQGITNFDLPSALDLDAFEQDLLRLLQGETIYRKRYTYNNPDLEADQVKMTPRPVILVDGIFVMHRRSVRDLIDVKLFLEASESVKLTRRIERDNRERGYDLNDVLYRYTNHVLPAYERFVAPLRDQADLIIPNNQTYDRALDVITGYIRNLLTQKNIGD